MGNPLSLKSLNHILLVCRSLEESIDFYQNLLGFCVIRRPSSFNLEGAWLFNYGIGIRLIQSDDPACLKVVRSIPRTTRYFSSMATVEKKLKEIKIEYVKGRVVEGGFFVDQIFFHDPDGTMIEIVTAATATQASEVGGEGRDRRKKFEATMVMVSEDGGTRYCCSLYFHIRSIEFKGYVRVTVKGTFRFSISLGFNFL